MERDTCKKKCVWYINGSAFYYVKDVVSEYTFNKSMFYNSIALKALKVYFYCLKPVSDEYMRTNLFRIKQ